MAYPTEAVYGLGCNPLDPDAFERLLALKQRPDRKGVILIAGDEAQLAPYLGPVDPEVRARVRASWPGPVTWLMPAGPDVPGWLTGYRDTIAVRVTDHPVAAALCRTFGGALVSTSANRSGAPPARSALRTRLLFGADLAVVLSGPLGTRDRPTAIIEASSGRVLRAG